MAAHAISGSMISTKKLRVPEGRGYTTKTSKNDDEFLLNSIKLTGIQQPLIVARLSDNDFLVIDGVRRLRIANEVGLSEVPCVIDLVPDAADLEHRNRIRFILDEHRQDLLPTQRAELIHKLQESTQMTRKEIALYLGVTSGTISNWTIVGEVIPDIQTAIDAGQLSVHSARAFAGMTQTGQRKVWSEHSEDAKEMGGSKLHRFVREKFPPDKNETYYINPKLASRLLSSGASKRKRQGRKRTILTKDKRASLMRDRDAKRIEIDDKKIQIAELQRDIDVATPIIAQLLENDALFGALPETIQEDFREFGKRHAIGT